MSTKENIQKEAEAAQEKLSEAADAARDEAEHAAEEARRAANAYADEGKRYAAHNIEDFATAVSRAGDELGDREQAVAARFVNEAADSLHHVAQSIESTSIDDMMDQVNRFARRNPGAFVIGAVLAGVALGRFAKASSDRVHGGSAGHGTPGGARRSVVGPSNPTS
jgi:vacuolar-type H+-ATPase subunit E/Vma4